MTEMWNSSMSTKSSQGELKPMEGGSGWARKASI